MKLLALRCPQCAQPLHPQYDETILTGCRSCQAIVAMDERGVRQVNVPFATPRGDIGPQPVAWVPFWVFTGTVQITRRQKQGGSSGAAEEARALWSRVEKLYMPGWELPVPAARELGSMLVQTQPAWQPLAEPPGVALQELTVTKEDALKLLEFVAITIEAERQDWLRDIQFTIETSRATVWFVPARENGRSWQLLTA